MCVTADAAFSHSLAGKEEDRLCAGDSDDSNAPTPLEVALPDKEAYQHIRALPCPAGSAVLFTHRLIHWGSAATRKADWPRIAISFVFSDPSFEVRANSFSKTCLALLATMDSTTRHRCMRHAYILVLQALKATECAEALP